MSTATDASRYDTLYRLLMGHPGYLCGVDATVGPDLKRFMSMAANLESPKAPDPDHIAAAFGPAFNEARDLIDKGVLPGLVLPDSLSSTTPTAEEPAVVEQPQEAVLAEALGVVAPVGIETTNTASDNTTAQVAPSASEQPAAVEHGQGAASTAAPAVLGHPGVAAVFENSKDANDCAQAQEHTPSPKAAESPGPAQEQAAQVGETPGKTAKPKSKPARRGPAKATKPELKAARPGDTARSSASDGMDNADPGDADTSDIDTMPIPAPKYPVHPLANILPMMSALELRALAKSIRRSGGLGDRPMTRLDGLTLDGRNRDVGCQLAGTEHTFADWNGEAGSPLAFVLRENVHRRNLSEQQRAMVAVRIKQTLEPDAIDRRNANLLQNKGDTDGLNPGHRSDGRSAELAASALNVSRDAVNKAAKILKDGAPELVAVVEQDAVSLDAAALVATLPIKEQRKVAELGQVKEKAKELREAKSKSKAKAKPKTEDADQGDDGGAAQDEPKERADGDAPGAAATTTASASPSTACTGEEPAEQAHEHRTSPTTTADQSSSAAAERPADTDTSPRPDASAKQPPVARKLTVEHVTELAVRAAEKKPGCAPDIIHRTAEAAGIEVLIVDAVSADALRELARILQDKVGDLASNDYQDACDVLTSIVEELWAAVNAHQPDGGERDDDYE